MFSLRSSSVLHLVLISLVFSGPFLVLLSFPPYSLIVRTTFPRLRRPSGTLRNSPCSSANTFGLIAHERIERFPSHLYEGVLGLLLKLLKPFWIGQHRTAGRFPHRKTMESLEELRDEAHTGLQGLFVLDHYHCFYRVMTSKLKYFSIMQEICPILEKPRQL